MQLQTHQLHHVLEPFRKKVHQMWLLGQLSSTTSRATANLECLAILLISNLYSTATQCSCACPLTVIKTVNEVYDQRYLVEQDQC